MLRRPVLWLVLALVGATGALALVTLSANRTYRALEAAGARRQAAYEFLMALRQFRQHIGEARVGLTGYVLTKDSIYRATYLGGVGGLSGDTIALRALARGQPTLQANLDRLGPALAVYVDAIAAAMRSAERGPPSGSASQLRRSRDALLLEGVREGIVGLEREQMRLMDLGARAVAEAVQRSRTTIAAVLAVGVVLLVSAGAAILAQLRAEREVLRLNAALEGRVAERTAELAAANKELEAFAYSVSHDLRGPLRTVDGFTRILTEDHAARLDEEGRRVASVIRAGVKKMAQLINDLLAFSRLGRQAIQAAPLDMAGLVHAVVAEVTSLEPNRQIDVRVHALPSATGDSALVKQVWLNLLSNAVKYTRQRVQAVIEVAGSTGDHEVVYTVRDNGVGFDMQFAGKLFGVFQRLHTGPEFEGTGVGLALVQRIVHRHGGRVWAEGKLNEGATFCFSLPTKPGDTTPGTLCTPG